jgi:hypothetical protein
VPELSTPTELTAQQIADFVTLLVVHVTRGNIERLGSVALGRDVTKETGNEIADTSAFAHKVVEVLRASGRLWELIERIREETHKNSDFAVKLAYVLQGGTLADESQTQAFVNDRQPFFMSARVQEVERALCAIGLGNPENRMVGSGFLVGADLVMTNHHVVKNFLMTNAEGTIVENASGHQIFCFFDYLRAPAPDVPPERDVTTSYMMVKAKEVGWLVHARGPLPLDGTNDSSPVVKTEFDYVVIRLEREIGKAPALRSGGEPRGWLLLPQAIDPHAKQRLMLVQHPEGAPQAMDMGDFVSLDRSGTRVRYEVSSAKGSSGSPAVCPDGLFALHNAEVEFQPVGALKRQNQGVRIDRIAQDLATCPSWASGAPAASGLGLKRFWTLNADLNQPQPIIGRRRFMEHVEEMVSGAPERLLVVHGPPGSGRRFSIKLLQRCLGSGIPVAVFTPSELRELEPPAFLQVLVDQLGMRGAGGAPTPDPQSTENLWLRVDLPRWLRDRLAADEARDRARYPAWVVIDLIVQDDRFLRWAKNLKDFVAGLVGVRDPGQQAIELPQLRWLVLGATSDPLALTGLVRREEDLNLWSSYADDFAECMRLAWLSIGRPEDRLPDPLLKRLAKIAAQTGKKSGVPLRQALAESVANLVSKDPDWSV